MNKIKKIFKYLFSNPRAILLALLLRFSSIIPDRLYLKWLYHLNIGRPLNLDNPKTFSEKIQWLKLYNRRPEYTTMVDKLEVKRFIANMIGQEYIIPTLGVWEKFEDIDFNTLPNQFVLKTTHGGGNSGVVICKEVMRAIGNKNLRVLPLSLQSRTDFGEACKILLPSTITSFPLTKALTPRDCMQARVAETSTQSDIPLTRDLP